MIAATSAPIASTIQPIGDDVNANDSAVHATRAI